MTSNESVPGETYFKVPMVAAHALAVAYRRPEPLIAYLVLCYARYRDYRDKERDDNGKDYKEHTSAGAKLMTRVTGISRPRCVQAMQAVHDFRGDGLRLSEVTNLRSGYGTVYRLPVLSGEVAYLPSMIVEKDAAGTLLRQMCNPRSTASSEVRLDAVIALLTLYAVIDYKHEVGASTSAYPWQPWEHEGFVDIFELGCQVETSAGDIWLVKAPSDDWKCSTYVASSMYPGSDDPMRKLSRALAFLVEIGAITRLAVASMGDTSYPLWYFNPNTRRLLDESFGINTRFARDLHALACQTGIDADNLLMRSAVEDDNPRGTGLFYCLTESGGHPSVRTLIIPRVYAPTPDNIEGLVYTAETTSHMSQLLGPLGAELRRCA
ncbi:hypothetical protein SAMN02800692_1844 [Luteibacter sp. UNC138MFCol5.1]|uniref:hypothetical protein n=1 Tax=Luteibacter sp. UNC138MFCol5.1 TaxID=1502774 RepID=UPI0008BE9C35|nr:hypothetical protein [Luteibacter sp. UNC138MFCol5.1]SEO74253.1 hypothetical protein SAMN02800692_1844 [Luteibacter sp. UNC138MFCol5.1]